MGNGNNSNKQQSEYNKFKQQEDSYLDSVQVEQEKKPNRWKELGIWVVAIMVLSTSIYFAVDYMLTSRDEVYSSAQVARLSAREAVDQMFAEDENGELAYIRRDLTQEEYDQIEEMVEIIPESSEKVQINIKLRDAGEQLQSQLRAIELVEGLKTQEGDPNVDLKRSEVITEIDRFPDNFNPTYALELQEEYQAMAKVITDAHDLKDEIQELAVQLDDYLDKQQLDSLQTRVDGLPFSDLKSQLTFDMKALFQEYDRQQEELEEQRLEEERRRKEEEKYRLEQEEIQRKAEEERLERQRREEAILEQQREEERQRQAEIDRQEREERERIEAEIRQELEEQQRIEQEEQARREQEEIERMEQEAREYEEQLRREQEEQERREQERREQEAQQQSEGNGE